MSFIASAWLTIRFGLVILVCVLMGPILLANPSDAAGLEGEVGKKSAQAALNLLKRVYAVGMPEKFPSRLTEVARTQPHVKLDYERDYRNQPWMGFIFPEFLRSKDRGLSEDLERFWKTPYRELLMAAPYLAATYASQELEMQEAITHIVERILSEARNDALRGDDSAGLDAVNSNAERAYLTIVERSTVDEHRRRTLGYLSNLPLSRLDDETCRHLLQLARGRDKDDEGTRLLESKLLTQCVASSTGPNEVSEYLLAVTFSDPCDACRGWALQSGLVEKYGREKAMPALLAALREGLRRSTPLASSAITYMSLTRRYPEAVPLLIEGLEHPDAEVRGLSILALQRLTGLGPANLGYPSDESARWVIVADHAKPEDLSALAAIAEKWKDWWNRE